MPTRRRSLPVLVPSYRVTVLGSVILAMASCAKNDAAKDAKDLAAVKRTPKFAFYTVDHYDASRNPDLDLAMTVERAKAENKRILVQVGGDWCGWCRRLSHFVETNLRVRDRLSNHFLLMKVNYSEENRNDAFLSAYPPIQGYPHLFVLESDGNLLHSQDTAALEQGNGYSEQACLEFLEKWKPGG